MSDWRRRRVHVAFALTAGVAIATACSTFSSSQVSNLDGGVDAAPLDDGAAPNDAHVDDASDADAGPVQSAWCGKAGCTLSQVCCWYDTTDAAALKCESPTDCQSAGGSGFLCHNDDDCAARGDFRCCGAVDGFRVNGTTCNSSECLASARMCTYAEVPDPCRDSGLACQLANAPQGFAFCR
jgi:hypothetical protein